MGIYNEILAGRFARGIQKIFSMKGEVPTKQLSGEIIPVLLLNDLTTLEHRFPLSVKSFTRSASVGAGGAGNRGAYRFRNPVGSNVIATIEKLLFIGQAATTDTPFITRGPTGTADLATIDSGNVSIRDLRLGPIFSTLVLSFNTNAGAIVGVQQGQVEFPVNGQADLILGPNQEIVVAPGDLVTLWGGTLNLGFAFTMMWRERALEESETFG